MEHTWWKEAVVYQIYPRSFCDCNGDGIGDLKGITSKLDYLKDLGVDVLWLCPIYKSPNDDFGYDISDYQDIMREFGTIEDFDELLSGAHKRGLKIILDLVVNHTSDEHRWFLESRSSKNNDKRDYYIWRKGVNGHEPNNCESNFTPSAWKYDETTGEYYLHLFSEKQPDLNWENENVRNEVYKLMTWWLDKGIDGFRMDVISFISKVKQLPSVPTEDGKDPYEYKCGIQYYANGPRIHEYLQEMNRKVLSNYDVMTVGETPGVTPEDAKKYAGFNRGELNMLFQFELMDMDNTPNGKWALNSWTLPDFKKIISKWQTQLDGVAWNSLFLDNHDQPRALSRFGNDTKYRVESGKMLATLLLTLQGTPYIYQGDEIGMTNVHFPEISDYRDIESLNYYKEALKHGVSIDSIMNSIYRKGRDNARTPMQWNTKANAGFSTVKPWLQVNPNYEQINVENSITDSNSILNYYKKLIRLRKSNPVLIYGSYELLLENDEQIFAYYRTLENEKVIVILNFSDKNADYCPTEYNKFSEAELIIGNYPAQNINQSRISLRPYEAMVWKIK